MRLHRISPSEDPQPQMSEWEKTLRSHASHIMKYLMGMEDGAPHVGSPGLGPAAVAAMLSPASRRTLPRAVRVGKEKVEDSGC